MQKFYFKMRSKIPTGLMCLWGGRGGGGGGPGPTDPSSGSATVFYQLSEILFFWGVWG